MRQRTAGALPPPENQRRHWTRLLDACRAGVCPREALGLHETSLSPATTRMVGQAAASTSPRRAHCWVSWRRCVAKQVGVPPKRSVRQIAADERDVVEPVHAAAPTVYLGLDGTGTGASPRSKAPWKAARRLGQDARSLGDGDEQGTPVRDPGSVCYCAAVESAASRDTDSLPSAFAQRAHREARRRGFDAAVRPVVLGDGANWIWNLAGEQFPGAIEIVDLYHVKGNLCDVAKAIYGAGTELAVKWAKDRHDELDAGRLSAIVAALRTHTKNTEEARTCIDYLIRNRHRMRYPQFRAKGLCVSSGVVEAGCKHTIGARLKCAGMRWTVAGANAIIALRCCKLSGRFEDFWARRAANAA